MLPELYIPGPVRISERTRQAMTQALMPHRSTCFQLLYQSTQKILQALAGTKRPVYLITAPSSALMESVARNIAPTNALCCCCGAFSERWADILEACGIAVTRLSVSWGHIITPSLLREALGKNDYELVTLVHCETSTGVLNPLAQLAQIVREYSSALLAVDAVSSFSATPVEMDQNGIDIILSGVQKALALPPGLAVLAVSERALAQTAKSSQAGFFLNYREWEKNARDFMTVATPSIPHIYALADKGKEIVQEGITARYQRHEEMRCLLASWAKSQSIDLWAPEGYRAPTVTCFVTPNTWNLEATRHQLAQRENILIDGGYGQFKGKSFRIAHMGNETCKTMTQVLAAVERSIILQ